MSEPQEHTVNTQFGEATVEIYECDSCGTDVAYENTVPFTIADREGRACEHCAETGPIGFPQRTIEWVLPRDESTSAEEGLGLFFFAAPIILPVATFVGFRNGPQFTQGYATAVVTLLLWVLLPLGIIFLL